MKCRSGHGQDDSEKQEDVDVSKWMKRQRLWFLGARYILSAKQQTAKINTIRSLIRSNCATLKENGLTNISGSVPVSRFFNLQASGLILKTIKEIIRTGHGPKQNKHPWFLHLCTAYVFYLQFQCVVLFWYGVLFQLCASSATTKQHPEARSRNGDWHAERTEIQYILLQLVTFSPVRLI